jgi:tetratricopeptide (TPR) repeat protein
VDAAEAAAPPLDTARPWPGLDAFTEVLSPFFSGRDAEADEMFRRVRRDLVTLLFGQSGLGKTSLLQAGLFPRLRRAGFLPILIRVDYSSGAPLPAAQIKASIEREFAAVDLSEATPVGAEESLWGYFHRVDRHLTDHAGKEIVPVLVFDQFEEVFTQGLAGDDSRASSQSFLGELAELIENRPPEALERAIEADPDLVESFSFDRQDYRIVLALREDFLASLESLRSRAPSLGRNRYRLRRMTGRQGLDAILNPAPGLVAPAVAQEIIRFIGSANPEDAFGVARPAGSAEGFEVEPSLLSLVCRELNERRIARGLDQIGADLLAGSRDDIIEGFYERVLADQPEALRVFVEDRLLSDSGFRESITLDSARRALSDAGVPATALDQLVRRRLLRIEERLDVARVEIIHDVLTPVIRRSRDTRHLRQAEAAAAEHEAALRRERGRVRRAYWLSAAMALLVVITIGVAWWGWSSKLEAEQQRNLAEAASERAERSLTLATQTADGLIFDIAQKFKNVGGVPSAMVKGLLDSARKLQEQLAVGGESSPGLRRSQAAAQIEMTDSLLTAGDTAAALAAAQQAQTILQDLVTSSPDSTDYQRELSVSHNKIGDVLLAAGRREEALAAYQKSLTIRDKLAAADPGNTQWQRDLSVGHDKIGDVLLAAGKREEALAAYQKYQAIADKLAATDPGNTERQRDLSVSDDRIGDVLVAAGKREEALAAYQKSLAIRDKLAAADPGNTLWQRDLSVSDDKIGDVLRDAGKREEALAAYQKSLAIDKVLARQDLGNAQWQSDLSWVVERISAIAHELHDPNPMVESAVEQVEICRLRYASVQSDGNKSDLAKALGAVSYKLLFVRRSTDALAAATEALSLDPSAVWIETNRAHALLFLGRFDEARAVYLEHQDQPLSDTRNFAQAVRADFVEFRKFGIDTPEMKRIEVVLARKPAPEDRRISGGRNLKR